MSGPPCWFNCLYSCLIAALATPVGYQTGLKGPVGTQDSRLVNGLGAIFSDYIFRYIKKSKMPIVRGASMMSLGTWKARSTKYQRFLNLSNVFLLIVSTILLFSAGILMSFYHLTKVSKKENMTNNKMSLNFSLTSGRGIFTPAPCACLP